MGAGAGAGYDPHPHPLQRAAELLSAKLLAAQQQQAQLLWTEMQTAQQRRAEAAATELQRTQQQQREQGLQQREAELQQREAELQQREDAVQNAAEQAAEQQAAEQVAAEQQRDEQERAELAQQYAAAAATEQERLEERLERLQRATEQQHAGALRRAAEQQRRASEQQAAEQAAVQEQHQQQVGVQQQHHSFFDDTQPEVMTPSAMTAEESGLGSGPMSMASIEAALPETMVSGDEDQPTDVDPHRRHAGRTPGAVRHKPRGLSGLLEQQAVARSLAASSAQTSEHSSDVAGTEESWQPLSRRPLSHSPTHAQSPLCSHSPQRLQSQSQQSSPGAAVAAPGHLPAANPNPSPSQRLPLQSEDAHMDEAEEEDVTCGPPRQGLGPSCRSGTRIRIPPIDFTNPVSQLNHAAGLRCAQTPAEAAAAAAAAAAAETEQEQEEEEQVEEEQEQEEVSK